MLETSIVKSYPVRKLPAGQGYGIHFTRPLQIRILLPLHRQSAMHKDSHWRARSGGAYATSIQNANTAELSQVPILMRKSFPSKRRPEIDVGD